MSDANNLLTLISNRVTALEQAHEFVKQLQKSNIVDRFDYHIANNTQIRHDVKTVNDLASKVTTYLQDFDKRLKKIEHFTEYLLEYFNPDKKMKAQIETLKKQLKQRDEKLASLEGKIKGILDGN